MNHIASVQKGPASKSSGDKLDPVVQRVVDSNPLLEAFGNAKTRRNDNSSRFGKYLQLQFDNSEAALMSYGDKSESKCKLAGSKCDVYLLEKNRITAHDEEERTFHIFYQLLAADDASKAKIWPRLSSSDNGSFKYVGHTKTTKIEGKTDAQHFADTVKVLEEINIKGDKLVEMMRAICAVMCTGNMTFGPKGDEQSEITSKSDLKDMAELMGVGENDLTLAFTERTMKTRTEEFKLPLKPEDGREASDAFAKEVYGNIFLWLVNEINAATCAEDNYKGGSMSSFGIIGLLDIFGFESFAVNRFEQLCINYANEKLQQKFTEDIFRSVQEEYEEEGIALAEIWYDDNTDVLDLIESRTGLLALLNEECVRPKGNDQDFVQKALAQNKSSPCMIINKMDRMSFGIHHYAGKVMYDADGFVGSNQDNLPTDLSDLMHKSTNTLIAKKQEVAADSSGSRGAPKRQKSNLVSPTIWVKYKTQLSSLMGNLRTTQSRYIRCIKPNMAKKPVLMDHIPTVEQLRCAGVVAAVTLSRSAFPNRLPNQVVRFRYASGWDPKAFPSKANDSMLPDEMVKEDCDAILCCALKEKEVMDKGKLVKAYVVGKTKSYFRAGALEFLESNRMENGVDEPATQIQKVARGFLLRKNLHKILNADKEAKRKQQEEEERRARELKAIEDAKVKQRAQEKARQLREAQEKKEREERERKQREEEEARKRAEREEQEAIERENKEMEEQEKKLQKKIKKLQKELEAKQKETDKKVKAAEAEADEIEAEKDELKKKHDHMMKLAAETPEEDIQKNQQKIEESNKIISYLKKENDKVKAETESMKDELKSLKDQNSRLVEASASAGASLDSLSKQKKSIADHNVKLEENLKKWKSQNKQLKADLANRVAYYKAETKIRSEYEQAMEKIVELLETRCDDPNLLEQVTAAQLQCEAIAEHKSPGNNPTLAASDVSDF